MAKQICYTPPNASYLAVSIIIPLFNAEKYIGDCFDSILAQTFQNFEVIVVDDCSTDKSCAIVDSYRERFNGRIKLVHTRKNSGSATAPRNLGIAYSRGEYLYFMDNDDVIMPTALEELYTLAKNFDADVVQCEKNYGAPTEIIHDLEQIKKTKPSTYPAGDKIFITKPTLLSEDLAKRAADFAKKWLTWSIWLQLIRRDFVIENQLRFVGVALDDMLFTICEICSAKRYLVVPNLIYVHRSRDDSLLWQDNDKAEKFLLSRMKMLKEGIGYLDKYLDEREAFAGRPDLKYALFNILVQDILGHLTSVYSKIPAHELDELLRRELADGDNLALNSFIFSVLNVQFLQMFRSQQQFQHFAAQAQQRIMTLENELKRKEL